MQFWLLGTNGFHVKSKNEWFTAAGLRSRQSLKYENFPSSFGRLSWRSAPKSEPHVQHDCFLFNQSNLWILALSFTLKSSFLKLPIICVRENLLSQNVDTVHSIFVIKKSTPFLSSFILEPVHRNDSYFFRDLQNKRHAIMLLSDSVWVLDFANSDSVLCIFSFI